MSLPDPARLVGGVSLSRHDFSKPGLSLEPNRKYLSWELASPLALFGIGSLAEGVDNPILFNQVGGSAYLIQEIKTPKQICLEGNIRWPLMRHPSTYLTRD